MKITPTYNSGIILEFEKGRLVIHEVEGKLLIKAPSESILLSTKVSDYNEIQNFYDPDSKALVVYVVDENAKAD